MCPPLRDPLPCCEREGQSVAEQIPQSFGKLLRKLRVDRGLSLEALARESDLSAKAISNLELGRVKGPPRAMTVTLLAGAFGLDEMGRRWLLAAARGEPVTDEPPVKGAPAPPYTLLRDINSFVGRSRELARLMDEVGSGEVVTVHVISGMAGVGKTALAIHAAHALAERFPDGQVFLQLSGHNADEQPAEPSDTLASLLRAMDTGRQQLPKDLEARAAQWRSWLAGKKVLLVLDDAVASRQIRPLLPGTAGSAVLITSRGKLTELEDAHQIPLDVLAHEESAELLVQLASRQDLNRDTSGVEMIAQLCGDLPLALGMLGRRLQCNLAWTPADLARELTEARDLPEEIHAGQKTVGAVLDLSYRGLTGDQQRMFRRLGLHPGADVDEYAAAALDDVDPAEARRHLQALCEQNVITEPRFGRYRFHDLIRALARRRALAEEAVPDRDAAVVRLLDYYALAAAASGRHLARRTAPREPRPAGPRPAHVPNIRDREQATTWMTNERLNLAAATEYASVNGHLSHAVAIPAAMHGFLRGQGYWDQALALHQTALSAAVRSKDRAGEAGALTDLGDVQYLRGDYAAAEASLAGAVELADELEDPCAQAGALVELGVLQQNTGRLGPAEASLTRALNLSEAQGDELGKASALNNLGVVQFVTSRLTAATQSQQRALQIFQELGDQLGEASALNALGGVQHTAGDYDNAAANLAEAAKLYESLGDRIGQAYTTGNLGVTQCMMGNLPAASASLGKALELYRRCGSRAGEADMLTSLGGLHGMTGDYESATASLNQALAVYRDLKDRLGEADALAELGVVQHKNGDHESAAASLLQAAEMARDTGEQSIEARALNDLGDLYIDAVENAYARARDIAADIGVPREEARALEGMGRLLLQSGQRSEAMTMLEQSLELYKRMNSPYAERVTAIMAQYRR
jgi:tetratricopeptide (TPR) repeat protein/transcriptional regulator with XRE-family HTH domain